MVALRRKPRRDMHSHCPLIHTACASLSLPLFPSVHSCLSLFVYPSVEMGQATQLAIS